MRPDRDYYLQRDEEMLELRRQGKNNKQIADIYGITGEAVRLRIGNSRALNVARKLPIRKVVARLYSDGVGIDKIADQTGYSINSIASLSHNLGAHRPNRNADLIKLGLRHCNRCHENKSLFEFGHSNVIRDGYARTCKQCAIQNARKYYRRNHPK